MPGNFKSLRRCLGKAAVKVAIVLRNRSTRLKMRMALAAEDCHAQRVHGCDAVFSIYEKRALCIQRWHGGVYDML
jgi:hypothetical protein